MPKSMKIAIVAVLIVAIGTVMALKQQRNGEAPEPAANPDVETSVSANPIAATAAIESATALPRLVELGADKCIPCKMMAPILEELRNEYGGQLQVDFFDVWKNPGIAQEYGIQSIPTQIFYDAQGNELFRHPGYFSKEDILAKWREFGVELTPKP